MKSNEQEKDVAQEEGVSWIEIVEFKESILELQKELSITTRRRKSKLPKSGLVDMPMGI